MSLPNTTSNMPAPGGPGSGPPPPGGSSSSASAPGRDDSYFTESRKGEVNELRQLLRTFGTERDKQRKRDIMKKVNRWRWMLASSLARSVIDRFHS